MKHLFLVLSLMIGITSMTYASDCYEKLIKYKKDSSFFTQHAPDLAGNVHESLDATMAQDAINNIYKNLNCSERIEKSNIECATTLELDICRVDVKKGYFILVKDFVDTVNILFNRWD